MTIVTPIFSLLYRVAGYPLLITHSIINYSLLIINFKKIDYGRILHGNAR